MPRRIVDVQQQQEIRRLRLRISRLRRRIDGRIRSTGREARRLASWRTYVASYPGSSVLAAFGVGLALSAGLSVRSLSRWFGLRLVRHAAEGARRHFWQELQQIWADSTPKPSATETAGGKNERP